MPEELDSEQIEHATMALAVRIIESDLGPVDPEGLCNVNAATTSRQELHNAMVQRFHLAFWATFRDEENSLIAKTAMAKR